MIPTPSHFNFSHYAPSCQEGGLPPSLAAAPVNSPELSRLEAFLRRAGVRAESLRRLAKTALVVAGPGGEITERRLRELTGYALSTVRLGCRRLCGLKVLAPVEKPLGRGYLKAYRVIWGEPQQNSVQNSDAAISRRTRLKDLKAKKQSKDPPAKPFESGSISLRTKARLTAKAKPTAKALDSSAYQGLAAAQVKLVLGARFYRAAMKSTRLELERWALDEGQRHAIEGMLGNRFDGMSLADARELVSRICLMRADIERLARSGASPKRLCSFIAGRLAGRPERAKREVLRRTARLVSVALDGELLDRRIAGLKAWLAQRSREYLAGEVCQRCGYRHSRIEFDSGYRDDGTGMWNCFGFARVKLEELCEQRKTAERKRLESLCLSCGGSLREGHVEGLCWNCWQAKASRKPPCIDFEAGQRSLARSRS